MPAYMIFMREGPIRDQAGMAEYGRINRENAAAFREAFKMTPLAVYGALEIVEGRGPDGVIILQFPSRAEAKAWYDSPAYQEALPHRLNAADYTAFIVEGL